ncbi:MAG: amidohydrolase family protein, partial [Oscillospiraceae bacterium]
VENGVARLKDGTIAGSASNLHKNIKNCINFGIEPQIAIKSATLIPATVIDKEKEIGSIKVGKYADLVLLDKNFDIKKVWIRGEIVTL